MTTFSPLRLSTLSAASLVICGLMAQPAAAFEPTGNDIADAYLEVLESTHGTVTHVDDVSTSGDTVTLKGITMTAEGDSGTLNLDIAELVNGQIDADDRLKLDVLVMEGIKAEAPLEGGMSIQSLSAQNILLPSAEQLRQLSDEEAPEEYWQVLYDVVNAENIAFTDDEGKTLTIASMEAKQGAVQDGLPLGGSLSLNDIVVPAEAFDGDERDQLQEMGYDSLTLSLDIAGKWNPDTSVLKIEDATVASKDMATVHLSFSIGGVTKELATRLQNTSEEMQTKESLALLQALTVNDLTLSIDNNGLYERALEAQAKKTGMDPEQLKDQLAMGLPMILTQIQDEALRTQVENALSDFMADPKSLMVKLTPPSAPSFGLLVGAGMMAPQSLPGILGVKVTANEPK